MAVLNRAQVRPGKQKTYFQAALCTFTAALVFSHAFSASAGAAEYTLAETQRMAQATTSDPLKGVDLKALETEKQRLQALKADPQIAALFSVVPGAGHLYAGNTGRGVWVLGGFAATLIVSFLGSYLLSSLDSTSARTAAVMVNIVPPSAYLAWGATDAYYQTALANHDLDARIREITLKQQEHGYYSTILQLDF